MASTINAARVIPFPVTAEQAEVSDETRVVRNCARDGLHGLASEQEPVTAIEMACEPPIASDTERGRRRRVFDRLLLVSFGSISPAYLFSSFPLDH